MKKIEDYKEEIHKCSKCGLCQSVCPVYQATGNDCAVSRGRFIMLNGVIKGDLKLNKNINKYLDMCLKCNACKDFCPSGIDAAEIFLTAKSQYFQNCPMSFLTKGFQSKFLFNSTLRLAKLASSTYRFLKMDNIARKLYPILNKYKLGKKIILANEFVGSPPHSTLSPAERGVSSSRSGILARHQKALNVVYFKGCVNEYINPKVKNATESLLARLGVEVLPASFDCCGIPFLSCGNAEQFKKQALFNISQIPDDFDYFLTDCASCQDAFRLYENYIDDAQLLEKLKKINQKSINVVDFVLGQVQSIEFKEETSFTFHKPCHLEDMNFLTDLLTKSKNLEYIEMKEYDKCCGFAGAFALNNPSISAEISKNKAKNALDTKVDYIVTACPSCTLGLTQGLIESREYKKSTPKVLNLVEFISIAEIS